MSTVLLVLLCVGFVIGVVCCCMGLYLVILRMRGVPKLGDVPGLGEIGTLQSGASLVLIGAYCFYYALSTYLPLQNGAVLQQRVDRLLVDTSRDLRKEYNDVKNAAGATINPESFARTNFLISFMQRIDENNGHAFYFSGEVRSPVRVVAPTRVKGGRSIFIARAAGPESMVMSSRKSSIAG